MKEFINRILLIFILTLFCSLCVEAETTSWLRINQLGYMPHSTKVAVLMCREDTTITDFTLIDNKSGQIAYSGTRVKRMAQLDCAKATYRLDLSDFKSQGVYRVAVGNISSPPFHINNSVYQGTADFVLNYMRQQQCGFNPFQNDSCHTKDAFIRYNPEKEGQYLDVHGGWHDAADLLQYTSTSANAIYQMMFAFEQNPLAFADKFQANGTPGSNGIPDIVDQIYWGMEWLDRMNPNEDEFYNQIADDRDHIGMKMPKDDPADYGRGPNNGRPVYFIDGKPQQRGKFMNATMGAASTAGKFASDFAMGSELLKPFYPDFATHIGLKAQGAFKFGLSKPGNTQTVSVVSPYIYEEDNWVDDMELGAIELFRTTGDKNFLSQAIEFGRREPVTPWMGADSARHYQWYPFMNMGHYRIASSGNERVKKEFIRNIQSGIDRVRSRALETNHPFYWGVPGIWCSNNLTVALLTQCILYRQLTGDSQYEEMEGSLRDWLFGCNPWGTSMIVELPIDGVYPRAPHSNWTFEGVGYPTGGLVDGPVYSTIFNSLKGVNINEDLPHVVSNSYLDVQPGDVVYHDNSHDYSTNEPTMDGTASLTYPLSFYEMEGRKHAKYSEQLNGNCEYSHGAIVRRDPSKKEITLVFTAHDMADGADTIINTLKSHNIKGAFFFTGTFLDSFPDIVNRLIADGHYIGTHSNGHLLYAPWENRDSCLVDKQKFATDLTMAFNKLAEFGITPDTSPYFIPPYEWWNDKNAQWAKELGLQIINYTPGTCSNADYTWQGIDNGDTYLDNRQIWDRIMKCERENSLNGHLLMIHLGTDSRRTEKFYNLLPQLIDELTHRGYKFVGL